MPWCAAVAMAAAGPGATGATVMRPTRNAITSRAAPKLAESPMIHRFCLSAGSVISWPSINEMLAFEYYYR